MTRPFWSYGMRGEFRAGVSDARRWRDPRGHRFGDPVYALGHRFGMWRR